jgi:CRISPR-associated protein Csd2
MADAPISKRYDFVLLFDVQDGNPNGDPDAGNQPRIDPQSLQGLVTDGCLKRKVRNAVAVLGDGKPGTDLFFQTQDAVFEKRVLNKLIAKAYEQQGIAIDPKTDKPKVEEKDAKKKAAAASEARRWMCEQFYDIRAFGAVMSTGANAGQVRGPVQLTFARSIDPIVPLDIAITRKSETKSADAEKQLLEKGALTGEIGRKHTVPYALYKCHGFVNPYLAKDTGFTDADLQLLWEALTGQMWEIDRSASRGLMATRGLYVFEHASPLGNAPAHELFDLIQIDPLGADAAPRSFVDYKGKDADSSRIHIPPAGPVRDGVTLHRMVG